MDKAMLRFVAMQPCWVTGEVVNVTVHHVREFGSPKNDRRVLPLVARLHMRTHETPGQPCIERGKKVFEKFWGVDIEEGVREYRDLFAMTCAGHS